MHWLLFLKETKGNKWRSKTFLRLQNSQSIISPEPLYCMCVRLAVGLRLWAYLESLLVFLCLPLVLGDGWSCLRKTFTILDRTHDWLASDYYFSLQDTRSTCQLLTDCLHVLRALSGILLSNTLSPVYCGGEASNSKANLCLKNGFTLFHCQDSQWLFYEWAHAQIMESNLLHVREVWMKADLKPFWYQPYETLRL